MALKLKKWNQLDSSHKMFYFMTGVACLSFTLSMTVLRPIVQTWNSRQEVNANHVNTNATLFIQHPTIKKINQNASTPTKNAFINQMGKACVYDFKHDKNVQVAPSVTIAQAIIESNWGQSPLYTKNHNAFGIKASKGTPSATYGTTEVYNGKRIYISAQFRAFKNNAQGVFIHNLMLRNKFIGKNHQMNYVKDAYLLHDNGYATDPNYANTIIQVIDTYDLNRFDKMAVK